MYNLSKIRIAVSKPVINLVAKPTPLTYIGAGKIVEAANVLKMNNIKKVLIITDAFLLKSGLLDSMMKAIEAEKIEMVVFSDVTPDPTFAIVEKALNICERYEAVIAVGGGSVLDTAKAVSAAYTNQKNAEKLAGLLKVKNQPLPWIAVPTTAGTGSETTVAAVISDQNTHMKKQILDPKIVPLVAILDPALTLGLPLHTTAFTTMDALTHALEAYVSTYANAQTNRYAEIAVKLIYENLSVVYKNPADMQAREALLVASFFAGMAFTRTYVGYVHAFAHTIGGKYGIPHGLANAVLLPHIMEKYRKCSEAEFAHLASIVGIGGQSTSEKAELFIKSIYAMNKEFAIPEKFEKFKKEDIDMILQIAFKECHGTYPVPEYYIKNEARELLAKVAI